MKRKFGSIKRKRWSGRRDRTRRKIARSSVPSLTVFRSSKHIYAQIVDMSSGRTIAAVSSRSKAVMGDASATGGTVAAVLVGKAVAEAAREKQIERVVFNRNGFLYHGRIKALAEAAREAGLQF